ncbi:MAG: AAA family ATPase [Caldilineales bacterium]
MPDRVFQLCIDGLPVDFPPLRSLDVIPNNLPAQVTSFVGRERELRYVVETLSQGGHDVRLLTLTGPGGTGKTRLSLQAAADLLDQFPDGVWFVELAPVSDPALVAQTIASALRLREAAGRPLDAMLADYLRDQHLLLVLDNCEHLIDECAHRRQAAASVSRGAHPGQQPRSLWALPAKWSSRCLRWTSLTPRRCRRLRSWYTMAVCSFSPNARPACSPAFT